MAPSSFTFPPGFTIEIFDGSNWPTWSSRILAICRINGFRRHIRDSPPATLDAVWDSEEHVLLGVFKHYVQKDIFLGVSDDTKFKTCKDKWEELQRAYGGVDSKSAFNTWVTLTGTALDDASPMLPQLLKLNAARNTLQSIDLKISDLQFSFMLIMALPDAYSAVASTILATVSPTDLSPQTIQERILNEEARRAGPSAALLVEKKKEKKDKSK